jgi:broad specificity phosphatase PhoE
MKEFYFIRHGQTNCNKYDDGKCYLDDEPLNKKGKAQANKTGLYLKEFRIKDKPFDCIISSSRSRAFQTANIIADQINFKTLDGNSEVLKDEDIKELGKGYINDYYKIQDKIVKKIKDPIETWITEENIDSIIEKEYNLENMDKIKDVDERVSRFIQKLKSMKENKVIIVSHYGFLFTELIPTLFNIPSQSIQHYTEKEDNCAICYVQYDEVNDKFKMIMSPSTEHLKIKI